MGKLVVDYMRNHGTKFTDKHIPTQIRKTASGKLAVTFRPSTNNDSEYSTNAIADKSSKEEEFDTVLTAIGREPVIRDMGLDSVGIMLHPATSKILVNDHDQTSQSHIFAIGDIVHEGLELTPVAIRSGKLLAQRLYGGSNKIMDYSNVPTTVFTPLEYSCVGLSEEKAIAVYGAEQIEVYHAYYKPLEWTVAHREDNACYCKIVCNKTNQNQVIGIHYLGPNAAEVMQGFALAVKHGLKYSDIEDLVSIHPSTAEEIAQLYITKSSGVNPVKTGC